MAQGTPTMLLCKGHKSPVLNCSGLKNYNEDNKKSSFYTCSSEFAWFPSGNDVKLKTKNGRKQGLIPYCKDCVQKIFEYYYENGNNFQLAVYYTCQKLDIPFIQELFESIFDDFKKSKSAIEFRGLNKKYMGEYIGKLNLMTVRYGDKLDFSYSDSDISTIDTKLAEREKTQKELDTFKMDWGTQDEADDYVFLNDTFTKYTRGMEFVNSQQEDLYRDLCRDRLALRKINDKRYDGDETMDNIQKRIAKLMSILKVDQFENNRPKTFSEESFFAKIAQIELTKPADLYKEPKKYEDFNKLQLYEKDMVLRPLLNTLCGQRDFNIDIDDVEKYNMDDE